MFRMDRDPVITNKSKGGGVCFLINDNWCTNVQTISKGCTKDLEHLTIKCRPFYLPREFTSITLTSVYIHPNADTKTALNELRSVIYESESKYPDSVSIILGDFNQANLKTVLPNYTQHVTCPTREDKTLDHCYSKIKSAYKSVQRSSLGNSDHSMVMMIPTYTQRAKSTKPETTQITQWTQCAVETLQDCFECTDWNVFRDVWSDIHEVTDTVTSYIQFCEEICLPRKTITVYPNSNVWFNSNIKNLIVAKDAAYRTKSADPARYKKAKCDLKKAIVSAKSKHRDKLNTLFNTGDTRQLWGHMNLITQYKNKSRSADVDDVTLPDKLNEFYSRFDKLNTTTPSPLPFDDYTPPSLVITEHNVRRSFARLNERKAAGPDNIRPRLLKACSAQLAPVFTRIFNWSLELSTVPRNFKLSTIIPVPKKIVPAVMNDYRPVALTSVIMKCLEHIFLNFVKSLLPPGFDMFQFAYTANRGVEDAISINIHEILAHLETKKSYCRILFIDYSSAFNTIIPQKLYNKLVNDLHFPVDIANWIMDFMLQRPQVVKIGNNVSETLVLNTGTPQGCVLSPKLYSLFTYDCKVISPTHALMVKFADDTTNTGFITDNDETQYREEVNNIEDWCDENDLEWNVPKTKEMIIDFRRNEAPPPPLVVKGEVVERVELFRFLGLLVSSKLTWDAQCDALLKRARQRIYFLTKLKSFHVDKGTLITFYRALIESVVSQSITVWYTRANQADINKLNSVIKNAARIIECDLPSLDDIYFTRMSKKTKKILEDDYHPANKYFLKLKSGFRFKCFKGNKRFVNSCYPSAVKVFNSSSRRMCPL